MRISLIAAVDKEKGIGKANQLLCHLPEDLKHFKTVTMSKPIIMGYKTFVSIGRALPGRRNLVLSRSLRQEMADIEFFSSLEQALESCQHEAEVMIIGGAQIYRLGLPIASRLYLTEIDHTLGADTFFPDVNQKEWQRVDCGDWQVSKKAKLSYRFTLWDRCPES